MGPHLELVRDFDHDAERAVLGAIFLAPAEALAACGRVKLGWRDFGDPRHQVLYAACREIVRIGRPVDPITLAAYLGERGIVDRAGGADYWHALFSEVPTASNVGYHADLVRRGAKARSGRDDAKQRDEQSAQVTDAQAFLDLDASAFFRFPWAPLDRLVSGIAPGTLSFLVGHPGGGKTSFLLSLITRLVARKQRVMYAGLETRPNKLRTQVAARVLGIDPGPIFAGDAQLLPNWPAIRAALKDEVERQRTEAMWTEHLRFSAHEHVDTRAAVEIMAEAEDFGADLVVVDHIDHVTAESRSALSESHAIVQVFDTASKRRSLTTLAAAQTNNDGEGSDPFRAHRHITTKQVWMGKKKEQVAEMFLGVYRPMRTVPEVTAAERLDVREHKRPLSEVLAQATTRVHVLKTRTGIAPVGSWVDLGYWNGEVLDERPVTIRAYDNTVEFRRA